MTMTVTMTVDGKGDDENDSKDDRSVTSVSLLRATPLPGASLLQSMISLMMMTKIKMMMIMMIIWRKGVLQIICHNFLSIMYLVCGMSYLVVYLELGIVSSVPFPSENYFAAMNIFYTNIDFAFQW